MDPLSQVTLGAAAAVALAQNKNTRRAALLGAVAGGLPDLDVLIQSPEDPLLALEYHRHFTHALVLVPLIGLVAASVLSIFRSMRQLPFRLAFLYATAGAFTHGLLDACTSYGTQLYWPFSTHRESWDTISIIDPLFTLPLLALLLAALVLRRPRLAQLGLLLGIAYLGFGLVQRERAETYTRSLAAGRGHDVQMISVRPSFANLMLWRLVYRSGENYHVDAVSILPWREAVLYPGDAVAAFDPAMTEDLAPEGSVLYGDIERFRHFSQGFLYRYPDDPAVIGDLRYAIHPDSITPLWGIRVDTEEPGAHVSLEYFRTVSEGAFERLWMMIQGQPIRDD